MNPFSYIRQHKIRFVSFLFVFLFFIVYLADSIFIYVLPGQAGILFQALSDKPVSAKIHAEGLYIIAPWNRMYIHDLTKQKKTLEVDALAKNGLRVKIRVSALFRPNPQELRTLTMEVGSDYTTKLLIPHIYSSTREIIGTYLPEELYTTAMHTIQDQILHEARHDLKGNSFIIEEVIIEGMNLPASLDKAIENKLRHQQDALAYEFILKKEADEAKRRKIEAESINAYQATINQSLNDGVLKWLEIRAMADLSKSKNSKIVVFGGKQKDIPLLLNPESKGK